MLDWKRSGYRTAAGKRGLVLAELVLTLIIIVILILIMGLYFLGVIRRSREMRLADNCKIFRNAVEMYYQHHDGIFPGKMDAVLPGKSPINKAAATDAFISQLTRRTSGAGVVGDDRANPARFPFGPYLRKIPRDTVNGRSTVNVLFGGETWPESARGAAGWIFDPATGRLAPDAVGTDRRMKQYFHY